MKLVILLAALAVLVAAEQSRYDFYRVYTVQLKTPEQLELMAQMQAEDSSYDFWTNVEAVGHSVDIMVPPHKRGEFSDLMEKKKFDHRIKIQNVQEMIDLEQPSVAPRALGWESYYRHDDINQFLDDKIAEYPAVASGFLAGQSYEGRSIRGIKISYNTGNKAIFVEANMHAREWISSATATYLINELLTSTDADVRNLAESYDWYIIPVSNPDGLEFSHTNTRLWRKTRRPNSGSTCVGTDANRNFDFQWMVGGGASTNPCSETYGGPNAFSEIEAQSIADFYKTIAGDVGLFLSFHSYGQYVLYPYGHTSTPAPNDADLNQIASAYVNAVAGLYGTRYTYGQTSTHLYVASGASPDWAYGTQGTTAAFTVEFRDTGSYGFQLPASQIIPNAREAIQGLVAMVDAAKNLGYFN